MNKVDKKFDEQFSGYMLQGTKSGGYDARPYVKSFIHKEIKLALESVVPEKKEEGQTKQCKDVLQMNYLIGLNKGFNEAIDQINKNIKEYLGEK